MMIHKLLAVSVGAGLCATVILAGCGGSSSNPAAEPTATATLKTQGLTLRKTPPQNPTPTLIATSLASCGMRKGNGGRSFTYNDCKTGLVTTVSRFITINASNGNGTKSPEFMYYASIRDAGNQGQSFNNVGEFQCAHDSKDGLAGNGDDNIGTSLPSPYAQHPLASYGNETPGQTMGGWVGCIYPANPEYIEYWTLANGGGRPAMLVEVRTPGL